MWKREYLGKEIIKTINVVSLLNLNFHFRLKSEDDNSDYRNILLEGVYIFCSRENLRKPTKVGSFWKPLKQSLFTTKNLN